MKQVLIGAVVGGILLFVWQYATWMFLDIHKTDQEPVLANEAAVVSALQGTKRGVYWIPGMTQAQQKKPDSPEYKAWEKKHEAGPIAWIVYDPEGKAPMDGKTMGMGGAAALVIALLVAWLLRTASIGSFFGRFLFVVGLGVLVALVMDVQGYIWMNHPMDWTRGWVIDHVGGMAIVGIALAAIVKGD